MVGQGVMKVLYGHSSVLKEVAGSLANTGGPSSDTTTKCILGLFNYTFFNSTRVRCRM